MKTITTNDAIEGMCCDCIYKGPCCAWYENNTCDHWTKNGDCWVSYMKGEQDGKETN